MTPQLRFPEFTDEWQVKKLGDLLKIGSGRDYKHLETGNIPVYGTGGLMLYVNDYLYDGKSIGIGRKGTIDQPQLLTGKFWTVDTLFYTYDHTASAPEFLYAIFQKVNWQKWNEASGVPSLSKTTIENIKVAVPKELEQEKIAEFLTAVDERIAAGEKKLELLQKYKKGVMQKIFTQQIRFKDENGNPYSEWDELELKDLLIKNTLRNKTREISYVQSVSNKYGFVSQDEYFDGANIASRNTSNYFIINKGTFAYNPSRINVGSLAYKSESTMSIVSPLYVSFQTGETLDDHYLLSWFSSHDFKRQMHQSFEGSVRETLSFEALSKMKIALPGKPEQEKIATFLTALDDKIAAEQTRLTAAMQWKKGLLQRMFV